MLQMIIASTIGPCPGFDLLAEDEKILIAPAVFEVAPCLDFVLLEMLRVSCTEPGCLQQVLIFPLCVLILTWHGL